MWTKTSSRPRDSREPRVRRQEHTTGAGCQLAVASTLEERLYPGSTVLCVIRLTVTLVRYRVTPVPPVTKRS